MKWLHYVTFLLVLVGALNWGLIGLFNFNVVTYLLGNWPMAEKVTYVLVGLSALWVAVTHRTDCRICNPKGK